MKRMTALSLSVILVLTLAGCSSEQHSADKLFDLSNAAKVEILVADTGQTVELSGESDVKHIADNLNTLTLEKQESSEPLIAEYTLTWYDSSDEQIAVMTIPYAETWLGYGGTYYTITDGNIDRGFLAEIVDIAVSTGPVPTNTIIEASGLVGIGRTTAAEAWRDSWGLKLTARDITPTGLTIVCEQQDGAPTGDLRTGSYYFLEVLAGGTWVPVETTEIGAEIYWTMEAWEIPVGQTTEWAVDWITLYGALPAGSYRIGKTIMDFRGTGDYDENTYYAGFNIVDIGDGEFISYEYNGFGLSLPYVAGWEYLIEEYADGCMSYGISYQPCGEEGWISFHCWDSFGVCGTGLEIEEYGAGQMGTYDNHAVWDFISFPASEGNFVAMTENVDTWWSRYGEAAMGILDRVEFCKTVE